MIAALRDFLTRRRIKALFGDQVSPALVDELPSFRGRVPAAKEVEFTPFFVNVNDYVGIAEQLPLARLPEFLGAYFDACTGEIQQEGGTIDQFVGDAIVARFGGDAPAQFTDHALRACVAALRCESRVAELRARLGRDESTWPSRARRFRVRIGMHTGPVVLGALGTKSRFNYSMMGDNVNLGARLEARAKRLGVSTLCSGATQEACERAQRGRVVFRPLGQIAMPGRAAPVDVFEPVGFADEVSEQFNECLRDFAAGLDRWREHDWQGARGWFEKSARKERHRPEESPEFRLNPSLVYLELARAYATAPGTALLPD